MEANDTVQSILSQSELQSAEIFFKQVKKLGWEQTKEHLKQFLESEELKCGEEKNVFLDLLFNSFIRSFQPGTDEPPFWDMLALWLEQRKLPQRANTLSQKEITVLALVSTSLREKLKQIFASCTLSGLNLNDSQQWTVITLWRLLFLNPFSAMNSYLSAPSKDQMELFKGMGYPGFLIASMYYPFSADEFTIDMESVWDSDLPLCCKTVITFWILVTPYFQVNDQYRRKVVQNIVPICSALKNHSEELPTKLFITFVEEAMTAFWRISYSGGNNVAALSCFGDFIAFQMSKLCAWDNKIRRKARKPGEKIRLGYISRNFHRQAVSFYMVNRVIHHDPDKFDVHVFVVGEYHDPLTDLFEKNSEQFQHFPNILDFAAIIRAILSSDLDILIYSDIGMDPITYLLSGLQLAPVQCALVGHGTTTGMPTIQYYISGDFESKHAQVQYRERLVRLPNLGAAQYLAGQPEEVISRTELGIPEDAIVFISCANGIKHGAERDAVLVNILQRLPNAWIILKPFANRSGMDHYLTQRLKAAASAAEVNDRLLIVSPVSHPASVMGLLKIADIQLDTYPYGGWTTNLEALYCGLPIITQEGELSRSRWGAGMLRSLGVTEGIAHTPDEYVDCAVRLASNPSLRSEICEKIKGGAVDTLFNGPQAQQAYETELTKIYQEAIVTPPRKAAATVEVFSRKPMTILTSLTPGNERNQRNAIATWTHQGFNVVSMNCAQERHQLEPRFPGISFVTTQRDGREKWGKPYVYFDDLLAYFLQSDCPICGIVNSDVYLWKENLLDRVAEAAEDSFLFGSRVDVDSLSSNQGQMYHAGFDYFFFDRRLLSCYPREQFCLGLPWWDYWAALLPLVGPQKAPCKRVTTPIALHVKHSANWDIHSWHEMGNTLGKYLRPPFTLSEETMPQFLSETATIIHKLSQPIAL